MKKNILLAFIFLFFLFLSAETNLLSFKAGNFSQNFSSAELSMVFFVVFTLFLIKKDSIIIFFKEYKTWLILIVFFLLSGLFSVILSPVNKIFVIKYYIRYILFIFTSLLFVFFIFINKNVKNYFYYILFLISFIFSLIAILEVSIPSFARILSDIFREGQAVYINNRLRPAATLTHSNIFACFMAISIIIATRLYFEQKINKFIYFGGIAFLLIGLSLSSSRNALFSFIISISILLFNKKYFKTIIIVLFMFFITYLLFSPSLKRISEIKTESSFSRILLWKASINMFKDYPLFGLGPGCFNKLLIKYAPEKLLQLENIYIQKEALNAHNGFFNILAEFGLSGIFILGVFFIIYLIKFIKLYPLKEIRANHSLLLVISLPFLPDAFFYSYFYMILFITILLSLLQNDF